MIATSLQDELDRVLAELEKGQREMDRGPVSQKRGEELEEMAKRAEELQWRLGIEDRLGLGGSDRTPAQPGLPRRSQPGPAKANGAGSGAGVETPAAYATPGEVFVASEAFRSFVERGKPKGDSAPMAIKSLHDPRVPLTREQLAELKALPTFEPTVLVPERIPDVVRRPERERLTLRDVLSVSGTTAAAVSYLVYRYNESAAPTPEAALKPESAMAFDTGLAPVRTIAVWIPVTEQMLEDVPNLAGTINSELLYDLRRTEEIQLLYGDGQDENLLGLLHPSVGVPEIPTPDRPAPANPTILDAVRRGITDVILRGGEPNAILMHPVDWEAAELTKATTAQYIWAVVRDRLGPRLWSLPVVENVHLQPAAGGDRQFVVGDFERGATLFDRRAAGISVGWISDQFVKNMRTIRAEERIAFAIKRPHFFAKGTAPPAK